MGSYTVLAAGACGASVWAFEPDPETVKDLRRNIELNHLDDRVLVHELALGERDGEVTFTRGLDTINRIATHHDINVQSVCMHKLDTLVGKAQPSMIKMDVEGHEDSVVRGGRQSFACDRLKVVELETVTPDTEAMLNQYGFQRAFYDPFSRMLTRSANDVRASNALFIKDWDFVMARVESAPPVRVLGHAI